jgi:NADH-quinone oxidoreductase subunit M
MNFPILSSLILLPTIGAIFLFFTKDNKGNNLTAKYVSLFTSIVNFLISIYLWVSFDQTTSRFSIYRGQNLD